MAVDPSCVRVDYTRDELLDDFSQATIKDRYLVDGEVSPQDGFARACAAFADDPEHAQRLYDYVSQHWFMFATPMLANGGTERGLPISCFLSVAEDSREGIFKHYSETGWLSSAGGGIGSYWGQLRSDGERTSRGSKSTGVIPFISVLDRLILAVSQGGTRRGSDAVYLDIHHPEIEEFITFRKIDGGDVNRKNLNLHNAVNVTDEFMEAVRDDTEFTLRSPKDGSPVKTVNARRLWRLILDTRMQTGEPYIHFIDTSNRALPQAQKDKGLRINHSNLCVTGATQLLTSAGYRPIEALEGLDVRAWNGENFSTVRVRRTNEAAELVRVHFMDGDYLDCTPYHKFYDEQGNEVRAFELEEGMVLEEGVEALPEKLPDAPNEEMSLSKAYASGWVTFAGFEEENRPCIAVSDETPKAANERLVRPSLDVRVDLGGDTVIRYEPNTLSGVGWPPTHWNALAQFAWLAGALDASNSVMDVDGEEHFGVVSQDQDLVRAMRRMALSLGLYPEVRLSDAGNVFMVPATDVMIMQAAHYALVCLPSNDNEVEPRPAPRMIVADVHPLAHKLPTFCATEPERGRLTFNGYITGNCSEIVLPTGRDYNGKMRTAVCCLSSLNAAKFDEWRDHPTFMEDFFRMLDNALTFFIENAGRGMENAVYSATMERSVGAGMLGFHTALQKRGIAFESEEARQFNLELFTYYHEKANEVSLKLGAERGSPADIAGTGHRFAHKLAIAPNASSSILCGGISPSIEPIPANAFLHKTLSGSFPVRNKQLEAALEELGMNTDEVWKSIVASEGSIQHLNLPRRIKRVFKTAFEIDQRWVVTHAADRTPLVCQSQSVNIFFPPSAPAGYINETHMLGWERGLKTFYYCRSKTARRAENTNEKIERAQVRAIEEKGADLAAIIEAGAELPQSDCLACEG